jgi:hypothetical protein
MKWTRQELAGIVAARYGQFEGQGEDAFLVLKVKITPELLQGMLGGTWVNADGTRARFDGVSIDEAGYAEPILTREVPA